MKPQYAILRFAKYKGPESIWVIVREEVMENCAMHSDIIDEYSHRTKRHNQDLKKR